MSYREKRGSSGHIDKYTNAMSMDMWLDIYNAPAIDLGDPDAITQRMYDFIDMCKKYEVKPGVGAWCQYLGCTRDEILAWSKGKRTRLDSLLTSASAAVLQKSFGLFEITWENAFLQNEFYSPVTGIFYAKNNFGYKDESETVVKHAQSESGPSVKELQAKYSAAIPESVEAEVISNEKIDKPKPKRKPRLKKGEEE